MSGLRFFATELDATSACIPLLDVGASDDLQELNPIIRLAGRDEAGGELFDHTALALDVSDVRVLLRALGIATDTGTLSSVTRAELGHLEKRLQQLQVLLGVRDRVRRLLDGLAEGESLRLADEGTTTIRCTCEHPASYRVQRWGEAIADSASKRYAVDLALEDRGLPPGEPVVAERTPPQGDPEAGVWQGIVDALGEHGLDAWVANTGGNCLAVQITWPGPGGRHALLTGAGPLCCSEDRTCNAGENWTLGYYPGDDSEPTTVTLDGTDVADSGADARVANLVAALLTCGLAESSGGF